MKFYHGEKVKIQLMALRECIKSCYATESETRGKTTRVERRGDKRNGRVREKMKGKSKKGDKKTAKGKFRRGSMKKRRNERSRDISEV